MARQFPPVEVSCTLPVQAPAAVLPPSPVTVSVNVRVYTAVPTIVALLIGLVLVSVGAVVSGAPLPEPLSLAHEVSKMEGTRLTARVRMHQLNIDFRDFLLRMRDLFFAKGNEFAGAAQGCQAGSRIQYKRNILEFFPAKVYRKYFSIKKILSPFDGSSSS